MKTQLIYKLLLCAAVALCRTELYAQDVPVPAKAQDHPVILRNATVHPGNGTAPVKADVLVMAGKIIEVGEIKTVFKNAETIDLAGKHIWPGLIAMNTTLGLSEIEAVRATRDAAETGAVNTNARSIIAYNTDSRVTPTVRCNGVLLAQVTPQGGTFMGSSSVVQLDAWTYEDATFAQDNGQHLAWPSMTLREAWWAPPVEEQKKHLADALNAIDRVMQDATSYHLSKKAGTLTKTDLRWEAMIPVLEKKIRLYVHAGGEKEIRAAAAFAKKYGVRIAIVGGEESFLCTDVLKADSIPVVIVRTQRLPPQADDAVDAAFTLPKKLQDAGVLYCITDAGFWQQRNLPFQAGTAVAYGLTPEQALAAVTMNPARILGIDGKTGSVEPGKDATLVVTSGDLLDMRTAAVEMAMIQGRMINLGNKQKDLYKKFSQRK